MSVISDDDYYAAHCIEIFQSIKILEGPLGLSSSLKNHKPLVHWLKNHFKEDLQSIEDDLDLNNLK